MNEKYLPIGSVVQLKGGKKKVMISGFFSIANGEDKTVYDYSGCIYPEGILNSNELCLFNNSQIEKIVFKGLENDEEKAFKNQLIKSFEDENDITISVTEEDLNKVSNPTFSINDNIFN